MITGRIATLTLATALAAVGVGCGSSGDDEGDGGIEAPSDDDGTLVDAEDVRSEALTEGAVELGETVEFGILTATVSNPMVGGDAEGPWLTVDVRLENDSDEEIQFVQMVTVCSGSSEEGGGVMSGEPDDVDLNAGLPPGTFDEGTYSLLLPGDGRYGEPRPICEAPGHIRIDYTGESGFLSEDAGVWEIPDELIAEMNAAPQPT